jgi:FkbM family methyltransferase
MIERLKYLLRSRSLRFWRDHTGPYSPGLTSSYLWRGHRIWYRPGTSDTELIYEILLKRGRKAEYAIDPRIRSAMDPVHTVLDVGANIGVSSVYLAELFSEARVFAFEPVPANFAFLERNTLGLGRVRAFLGECDGTIDLLYSDVATNLGGFSRFEAGSDTGQRLSVPMRSAREQVAELGIDAIDVLKIDVEGSEWEVLSSLGQDFLRRTTLVMGELHGRLDFQLLAMLSEHFRISVKKNLDDRCFMFQALNRKL